MRFNDLMHTVLASQPGSGIGAITLWRQCIDILAQYDREEATALAREDRARLVEQLERLRPSLTEAQRIASVVELGRRLRSPALVEFFASDRPAICVAAMVRADVPDNVWQDLLPRLSPTARGILRSRRDVGEGVQRALAQFGSSDLVLGEPDEQSARADDIMTLTPEMLAPDASVAAPEGFVPDRTQIRDLVERIERFTSTGRAKAPLPLSSPDDAAADHAEAPRHFPFETDATGCLIWVGEASRAALVGLSIAEPAIPGSTGADGNIAGAFARRSSFQHGRFWISDGPYGGEWRLSATPFFDQRSGRFQGYRGQARRPHVHEVPFAVRQTSDRQEALSFDSMRQLIHELRTPLNAILGFAEIIEQQLFGPAGVHYREMAGHILSDARRLLTAFDDLDLAARSSGALHVQAEASAPHAVAVEGLIDTVTAAFASAVEATGGRQTPVRITAAAALPAVRLDPAQGERMLQHLIRTLVSVTGAQESLHGSTWFQPDGEGGRVLIAFDRPKRLRGLEETQLLDPGYGADGDWPDAPLLGLGFSLRLVRSLVGTQRGDMIITPDRIMLSLPVADAGADGEVAHP